MKLIYLDFETRCEIDLTKVGAHKYTSDETFRVLCLAWAIGNGPVKVERNDFREILELAEDDRNIFEAHNAAFEYCIWHNYMVPKLGAAPVPVHRWRCSAAAASYKSMPRSLWQLAKALGTRHQKDEDGRRVMLRMCKPVTEKHQHLHGKWHETEEDFKALLAYCIDDVLTEREVSKLLGHLPKDEQKVWELDQAINNRGIYIDTTLASRSVHIKQSVLAKLKEICISKTGCAPSQVAKLTKFLGIDDIRAQTIKTMLADDNVSEEHKEILQMRQDYATTSLAKYDAVLRMHQDNVVRGQFIYHGCTTGRWTGKGIQFQNLPRGQFDEDLGALDMELAVTVIKDQDLPAMDALFPDIRHMGILKSTIRGLVISRPSHVLRVLDFSQIEARVLAWLAGQSELIESFKNGSDLYKFTAAQIYQKSYDDITKQERFTGKTAALAFGYQGGEGAYRSMALNLGVNVEKNLANEIKDDWRHRNKKIVKLWYDLEAAAVKAVKLGKKYRVNGRVSFQVEGDFLTMELPSGRKLWYYKPETKLRMVTGGGSFEPFEKMSISHMGSDQQRNIQWGRIYTYGGKLCENAVQAIARDILVYAMQALEEAGYKVIGHIHDECICETPKNYGSLKEMKDIMLDIPDWASGLPVDASGFETTRYRKE